MNDRAVRVAVIVFIVVVVLLMALAALGYCNGRWDEPLALS